MADHLTPLDAAFLELEDGDEASHMHVGWTLVFEPLPDAGVPTGEQVVSLLRRRLDLMPHFRTCLSTPRVHRFSWPEWVEDDAFDVANHVRRATLPSPGGEPELLDWLGDFYSHRLDRRPPAVGVHPDRRAGGGPLGARLQGAPLPRRRNERCPGHEPDARHRA